MADRNRYEDRPRRRERREDEGFLDKVRDWFTGDEERGNRNRDYDRDYARDRSYDPGRGYDREGDYNPGYRRMDGGRISYGSDRARQWREDYERIKNRYRDYDRDYDRDYNRDRSRDNRYDYDYDRDFARDRDYARDSDYNRGFQSSDPRSNFYGSEPTSRYGLGRRYGRFNDRGYGLDYDYDYDAGRTYDEGETGYGYDQDYDYNREYNRSYGRGRDYQSSGWRYEEGPDRYSRRSGWRSNRPYPTAGMRSDYEGSGYNDYGERDRYRGRDYDYDQSFDRDYGDYVGYESEGAFYQDLDNPYTDDYWETWAAPGAFTGMGPSNYNRSDERISEDVCERLTRHGMLDASDIEVKVQGGSVTLSGSVPERKMKYMAEDSVEGVTGVKDVRNDLRVNRREGGFREGAWYRDRERAYRRGPDYNRDYNNQQDWSTTDLESEDDTNLPAGDMRLDMRRGMEVVGSDGKRIGQVKEIRVSDFVVDREMGRDIAIPHGAVKSAGEQVMLRVPQDKVNQQNWEEVSGS